MSESAETISGGRLTDGSSSVLWVERDNEDSRTRLHRSRTVKVEPIRSSDSSEIVPFISLANFLHMYYESKKKKRKTKNKEKIKEERTLC